MAADGGSSRLGSRAPRPPPRSDPKRTLRQTVHGITVAILPRSTSPPQDSLGVRKADQASPYLRGRCSFILVRLLARARPSREPSCDDSMARGPAFPCLVPVGGLLLHPGEGDSVHFRVGVDEVVQRWSLLGRIEHDIASAAELNAILVVGSEEVFLLLGVLARLRGVHGNPPE